MKVLLSIQTIVAFEKYKSLFSFLTTGVNWSGYGICHMNVVGVLLIAEISTIVTWISILMHFTVKYVM